MPCRLKENPLANFPSTDNGEMEMLIMSTHPQIVANAQMRPQNNFM